MRFARLNVGMFGMRGALFVKSAPPFHELNSRAVGWWSVTKKSPRLRLMSYQLPDPLPLNVFSRQVLPPSCVLNSRP